MPRPFLTADWRKLIMAQYEVPPEILVPHLPRALELDLYTDPANPSAQPRCFVSLVGFLFDHVRVLGLRIPRHTRFPEINLRFYVRRTLPDGTRRRGVIFLSEVVPRRAITLVARTFYGEPYRTHPMRHRIELSHLPDAPIPDTIGVSYALRLKGRWQTLAVTADPTPTPMAHGSLEEFITEHYFGYTRHRRGASEYEVQHPRWSTYPIRSTHISFDTAALYGPAFATLAQRPPDHILLAEGSRITVLPGHRLD